MTYPTPEEKAINKIITDVIIGLATGTHAVVIEKNDASAFATHETRIYIKKR